MQYTWVFNSACLCFCQIYYVWEVGLNDSHEHLTLSLKLLLTLSGMRNPDAGLRHLSEP